MNERDTVQFSAYAEGSHPLCAIVRRKRVLRLVGAALWFAGWTLACTLWGRSHNEYFSPAMWTLLGLLIGCLAWPIFRLRALFRDRDFAGTITAIERLYVYYDPTPWLTTSRPRKVPQIEVTIRPDAGEPIKYRFPHEDEYVAGYYHVGDCVRHYRGLRYLEKLHQPEDVVICVACGRYSYITEDVCEFCKKPLLKSDRRA